MESLLKTRAQQFMDSLRPRVEPDLGVLKELLNVEEMEAIETVLNKRGSASIRKFTCAAKNSLARLQMVIGLESSTVAEQVRNALMWEMGQRENGWWETKERFNILKQVTLVRLTDVSKSQINKFLHHETVNTETLDRISSIVRLRVIPHTVTYSTIYGLLASHPSGLQLGEERDESQSVTQQVRQILKEQMAIRRLSQKEVADWTGVAQSGISRFLQGKAVKTTALDRLGAFFWIEIELVKA
jgi:predicted XRE-type DNA-binding protein